jgi:hypothetical protein
VPQDLQGHLAEKVLPVFITGFRFNFRLVFGDVGVDGIAQDAVSLDVPSAMLGLGSPALRGYGQTLILKGSEVIGKSNNFRGSQNSFTSEAGFSRRIFPPERV